MNNSSANYFNWLTMLVVLTSSFFKVLPEKSASSPYQTQLKSAQLDSTAIAAPSNLYDAKRNENSRKPRQLEAGGEQHEKCRLFIESEPGKNELYSPDYPNDYPKNINCTRIITAPKGQIIRLDFRNSFYIEAKDECKFDFLEIRDGQYGFSNLIGKFCGTDFPPEITSKERYLWLHFHSDESIEYSGFTAVYEFIDRNREAPSTDLNCTIEKDGYEGFINSTDVPHEIRDTVIKNKVPLDCMWRIQVEDKWKIQVKFLDFKLSKPNDCETNFLDIFPEETVMPLRVKNFCGSAGEGITSESNILHMRFFAEQSAINSTFAILYTAFRDRGSAACTEEEYDCEDATCISKELECNGRDNCKFRWDEETCTLESTGQSEHVVIIIIVFGLILGGMVITFLVNCIRKIMRDQKIIQEHVRQSKESQLDEMGRNSKQRSKDSTAVDIPQRQKHSQVSLVMLDDSSHPFYRAVPAPIVAEVRKDDGREKEHSILRHHHDVNLQTSICSGDDSSTATTNEGLATPAEESAKAPKSACDMGCQTRESLFMTPTVVAAAKYAAEGRGSFGQSAPSAPQSENVDPLYSRGINVLPPHRFAARPQEVCHLHHRHPQHVMQPSASAPQAQPGEQPLYPPHHPHHHHHTQHQQRQQRRPPSQQMQTSIVTVPLSEAAAPAEEQALGRSDTVKRKPMGASSSREAEVSRNSAPDVIIMTSH